MLPLLPLPESLRTCLLIWLLLLPSPVLLTSPLYWLVLLLPLQPIALSLPPLLFPLLLLVALLLLMKNSNRFRHVRALDSI